MNLSGTVPFTAPQTAVWQSLTSPEQLCGCLPGLLDWQIVDPHHFQLQIAWPFGPPVIHDQGGLKPIPVTIRWTQLLPPTQLDTTAVFHLNKQQSVEINGRFTLTPLSPHTSELHFQAQITSPNPFIDQLIRSLTPRLIDSYFACLKQTVDTHR
jgi:carbon monoxide dehydrogenase subunit G